MVGHGFTSFMFSLLAITTNEVGKSHLHYQSKTRKPLHTPPLLRRNKNEVETQGSMKESQNNRTAEAWRHLCRSSCPTPMLKSQLLRTTSREVLKISKAGDSTDSLSNLFQCLVTNKENKLERNLKPSLLSHAPEEWQCHDHGITMHGIGRGCLGKSVLN